MVHGSTPSGKRVVQSLPLRVISRMSATNNLVDLGATNAQRLTAIEARVRPTVCPTTRTAGRTIERRITEDNFEYLARGSSLNPSSNRALVFTSLNQGPAPRVRIDVHHR